MITNDKELLTVRDISNILKISRSNAYSLTKRKGFPLIRIGKCIRVLKSELFKWLHI